ncbi:MAG: sigma-70 family RNA polymerase sigma factor [Christensenellaceae bacterium]
MSWACGTYNVKNNLSPLLTEQEEKIICRKMKRGDQEARRILIEKNIRLAAYVAKNFYNTGIAAEDLISVGCIGLVKAIDSFDAEKNIRLSTYASRCITNEICMFLRKNGRTNDISLESPLGGVDGNGEICLMDSLATEADSVLDEVVRANENREVLKVVRTMPSPYKEVLVGRYGLNGKLAKTQKQIAQELCMTQSCVSKLEKKAISQIRQKLERRR